VVNTDDDLSAEEVSQLRAYLDRQEEANRCSDFDMVAARCLREIPFDGVRVGERYAIYSYKGKPLLIVDVVHKGGQKYFQLLSSRHSRISGVTEIPLMVSALGVYRREPPQTPLPMPKTEEAWNQLPRDRFGMQLWFWRVLYQFVHCMDMVAVKKQPRPKRR